MRFARRRPGRFDDVGINRALRQPSDVLEPARFTLENVNELAADDLTFLLGVRDALQSGKKFILGIDPDDVDSEMLGEHGHDLIAFVEPQQAVVNENTDELVANGFVQQCCDNRRIHAAR